MLYSQLFGKTQKTVAKYESKSHELLTKAGFINQVSSGIFNFLPLGKRVIDKIQNIIKEELNKIGAQEILMPILHPKNLWEKTNRWNTVDVLFKTKSNYGQEYALAPTHEETVTPLVKQHIKSYRDLPLALYHITTKLRDEPRPKSGILRGREFLMKDLYSFHADKNDLHNYYQKVIQAYLKIFNRCGLNDVKITEASGGSFTKNFSHEFNVLTPAGEVNLIYCQNCNFAQNIEISQLKENDACPQCQQPLLTGKAIEIGNIFDLETKFSQSFDLKFTDKDGKEKLVLMGCYGIGISRLMGAVVEIYWDNYGIIWPKSIAPYKIHLVGLNLENEKIKQTAFKIYHYLQKKFKDEVLFDDRLNVQAGEKLADADLIGLPIRLVVSKKTGNKIEFKLRQEKDSKLVSLTQLLKII
ncbi:MAG: proline--tRNA ligase [Microgenomates group bacterium]